MVKRDIIRIDEEKCNGCGKCVTSCAEGALKIIDGKAKLVSENYCDGLGACLGSCPMDAITIEKREADEFDEEAVKEHLAEESEDKKKEKPAGGMCPGMMAMDFGGLDDEEESKSGDVSSKLSQWPVQLKLISADAPLLKGAELLLAADCVAFAMGDFHEKFLKDKKVAVGCPKLDDSDYYIDKLAEVLKKNDIAKLTVVHMQVPCCSGMTFIAEKAVEKAGVDMEFEDITVSLKGKVLEEKTL